MDVEQHFLSVKEQLRELKFAYDFNLVQNVKSMLSEGKDNFILQTSIISNRENYVFDLYFNKNENEKFPTLDKYDLTSQTKAGDKTTQTYKVRGEKEPIKLIEAIVSFEKSMSKSKGENMYAYLKDEYGNITDISHKIQNLSDKELIQKRLKVLDIPEYKQEYGLDISDTNSQGHLITNVIYIKCNNTDIASIEAPKADEIECCNCKKLESVSAPRCMQITADNSPLLNQEKIEAHPYYCNIEGVGERKNPIKIKF